MIRFLICLTCACALTVGCTITRKQAAQAEHTVGDVAQVFGIPRGLAEGAAGLVIAAACHTHGKRRGKKAAQATAPVPAPQA